MRVPTPNRHAHPGPPVGRAYLPVSTSVRCAGLLRVQDLSGPTEAINVLLETLRRFDVEFLNLLHHRIRSLPHCGNLSRTSDALSIRRRR
jgi:hypothetical protein